MMSREAARLVDLMLDIGGALESEPAAGCETEVRADAFSACMVADCRIVPARDCDHVRKGRVGPRAVCCMKDALALHVSDQSETATWTRVSNKSKYQFPQPYAR